MSFPSTLILVPSAGPYTPSFFDALQPRFYSPFPPDRQFRSSPRFVARIMIDKQGFEFFGLKNLILIIPLPLKAPRYF